MTEIEFADDDVIESLPFKKSRASTRDDRGSAATGSIGRQDRKLKDAGRILWRWLGAAMIDATSDAPFAPHMVK